MTARDAIKKWRDAVNTMYEAGSELGLAVSLGRYENDAERVELNEMFRVCDKVISAYEREAFGDEED